MPGYQPREWRRDAYVISNDPSRLQLDVIHGYLTRSYWAEGIPRDLVARSIRESIPYGVYRASHQVGFGRVISDVSTFAYLADVFVLESHRGRGLASWLMECILATPELQGLRRWMLITRDAHALYRKAGFSAPARPENVMERVRPHRYTESED